MSQGWGTVLQVSSVERTIVTTSPRTLEMTMTAVLKVNILKLSQQKILSIEYVYKTAIFKA